jgi:hypothetical protein
MTSLKIHVPRCRGQTHEKKEELQQILKQIREKYNLEEAEKWTDNEIESYNKEVKAVYKQRSLFECKYCHRTFFEESLKKHIKHCEKDYATKKTLRRSQTMKDLSSPERC